MTAVQRNITLTIAAAVLIGVGFFVGRSFRASSDGAPAGDGQNQRAASTNPEDGTPAASVPKSFFELRREYDELSKTPAGVQWDFIEKAEAYARKTKDSTDDNDIRTLDLLTDCYLKLGELEDARAAFRKYLEEFGGPNSSRFFRQSCRKQECAVSNSVGVWFLFCGGVIFLIVSI